jgi:hypothetical protein
MEIFLRIELCFDGGPVLVSAENSVKATDVVRVLAEMRHRRIRIPASSSVDEAMPGR